MECQDHPLLAGSGSEEPSEEDVAGGRRSSRARRPTQRLGAGSEPGPSTRHSRFPSRLRATVHRCSCCPDFTPIEDYHSANYPELISAPQAHHKPGLMVPADTPLKRARQMRTQMRSHSKDPLGMPALPALTREAAQSPGWIGPPMERGPGCSCAGQAGRRAWAASRLYKRCSARNRAAGGRLMAPVREGGPVRLWAPGLRDPGARLQG